MVCEKCKSTIYPVSWTEDIERMFDYYQKTVVPEKKSSKQTKSSKECSNWLVSKLKSAIGSSLWISQERKQGVKEPIQGEPSFPAALTNFLLYKLC